MKLRFISLTLTLSVCICSCNKEYILAYFNTIQHEHIISPVNSKLTTINFVTPQIGFIGSEDGKVLKTSDGGITWATIVQLPGTINKILFRSPFAGFSCTSEGIYQTTNGGENWFKMEDGNFQSVALKGTFGICAVGYNSSGGFVYTSIDGVETRTETDNEDRALLSLFDIDFETSSVGYCTGNFMSVYRTTDGGITWQLESRGSNKPEVKMSDVRSTGNASYFTTPGGELRKTKETGEITTIFAPQFEYPFRAIDIRGNVAVVVGENSVVIGDIQSADSWRYFYAPDGSTIVADYYSIAFSTDNTAFAVGDNGKITRFDLDHQ